MFGLCDRLIDDVIESMTFKDRKKKDVFVAFADEAERKMLHALVISHIWNPCFEVSAIRPSLSAIKSL